MLAGWPAQGAMAGVITFDLDADGFGELTFEAGPGEANDLSLVGPDDDELLHVSDAGAPLTAGPGCVSVDANTVTCLMPFFETDFVETKINLGDMDDQVVEDICWDIARVGIVGGSGADRLFAGADQARLYGGPGPDVMDSPGGTCTEGGGAYVSYASRTAPVFVTLDDQPNDGEAGEGDLIGAGVTWILGGSGDDVLRGDSGSLALEGRGGSDLIVGLGGTDILFGQTGDDRLLGGPGRDDLSGDEGDDVVKGNEGPDWLSGGRGRDVLEGGPGNDRLGPGLDPDIARGGPGNDRIEARDAVRDMVLGGPGTDGAWVDLEVDRLVLIELHCPPRCPPV